MLIIVSFPQIYFRERESAAELARFWRHKLIFVMSQKDRYDRPLRLPDGLCASPDTFSNCISLSHRDRDIPISVISVIHTHGRKYADHCAAVSWNIAATAWQPRWIRRCRAEDRLSASRVTAPPPCRCGSSVHWCQTECSCQRHG